MNFLGKTRSKGRGPLSDAYDAFMVDKELQNVTDRTLDFYKTSVGKFVEWSDCRVSQVQEKVDAYILMLRSRVSAYSVHTYVRGIKTFCRWLESNGYTGHINMRYIKAPETVIETASAQEIRSATSDLSGFTGLRNATMVLLIYDTGVRLSELLGISLSSIDLPGQRVLVKGKGRKERYVPMSSKIVRLVRVYMKRRDLRAKCDRLFISDEGKPLSYNGAKSAFRRLGIRPHKLRHSFATGFIEMGGSEKVLQRILGHTTTAMTHRYVQASESLVRKQHEMFSPLSNISLHGHE